MVKKEWIDWLKCNVLEIIILILVLVLLVKVYSAPAVQDVSDVTIEKPVVLNEIPSEAGEALTEETPAEIVVSEEAPTLD